MLNRSEPGLFVDSGAAGGRIDELLELITNGRPVWQRDALCREHPEVDFFPGQGGDTEPAKAVCAACLVAVECLDYALADKTLVGVWAGTGARARAATRRAADRQRKASA